MGDPVLVLLLASLGAALACFVCATPVAMMASAAKVAVWTCACICAIAWVAQRIENKH